MAPILGYLFEFWVDFKEQYVFLVNEFYLPQKIAFKDVSFLPHKLG